MFQTTKTWGLGPFSSSQLPALGRGVFSPGRDVWGGWGSEANAVIWSLLLLGQTHLPNHLGEVIHVGGAQGLRLEALGLEQVLGDVGGVDEHPVLRPLLVPMRLKHDLERRAERWLPALGSRQCQGARAPQG